MPGTSSPTGKAIIRRVGTSVGLGGAAGGAAGGAVFAGTMRADVALGAGIGVAVLLAMFGESLFKRLASILRAKGDARALTTKAAAEAKVTIIKAKADARTKKQLYKEARTKAQTVGDVERLIQLLQGSEPSEGDGPGQPGDGPDRNVVVLRPDD